MYLLIWNCLQERAKIKGKRKPPSRQARQEAIRASSIEESHDNSLQTPPPSSNLKSPSTDEEDLFSVPPLDSNTDCVKTSPPKTDIFGIPTALSPNTKPELPSSFVSTPFFQSQPPPLEDEEEEDVSCHGEDICEHQDTLKYEVKNIQSKELQTQAKEKSIVNSLSNLKDDYLFSNMRDEPPPLTDDEDEQGFGEHFSSNGQTTNFLSPNIRDNGLLSSQNQLLNKSVEITNGKTVFPSSDNSIDVVTDESLFASDDPTDTENEDFLFSSNVKQYSLGGTESTLSTVSSSLSKSISPNDSLFSESIKSQDLKNDSLLYSKGGFSQTNEDNSTILTNGSQTLEKYGNFKSKQFPSSDQKVIDDPLKYVSKKPDSVMTEKSASDTQNNAEKNNSLLVSNSSIKEIEPNDLFNGPSGISLQLGNDDNYLFTQSTSSVKEEKNQQASGKSSQLGSDIFNDNENHYFQDEDSLFSQTTNKFDKIGEVEAKKTTLITSTSSPVVNNEPGVKNPLLSSGVKFTEPLPKNTLLRSSNVLKSILSEDKEDDDDYLFASSKTINKGPTKPTTLSFVKEDPHPSKKNVLIDDDDEKETTDLFSKKVITENKKSKGLVDEKQSLNKKSLFFEENEDDDSSDLFSAKKNIKKVPTSKSSLFGNDEDEDDIFGSSSFNKSDNPLKKTLMTAPVIKTSQLVTGNYFVFILSMHEKAF